MNQEVIINDDHVYDKVQNVWRCSAMLSGNKVDVFIYSNIKEGYLTQDIKFDWEYSIEEWLEKNEPDKNNQIKLTLN